MVYISGSTPKRTPLQKALRVLTGIIASALIVFVLWQIPYDILREERYRLFGETRTIGVVTGVYTDEAEQFGSPFIIEYKYVDSDGYARQAVAPLPRTVWGKFREGNRVEVYYATTLPALARIIGEVEPPFQLWLRDILH